MATANLSTMKAIPSSAGATYFAPSVEAVRRHVVGHSSAWRNFSTSDDLLDAHWREQRAMNRAQGRQIQRDHRASYSERLSRAAGDLKRKSVGEILDELAVGSGLLWTDIAGLVGVSVPGLRKWRRGGGVAPDSFDRLVRLAAFLRLVRDVGVAEPAMWMTSPLVEGFEVTPSHVYKGGHALCLVDVAAGNLVAEAALDESIPDWRAEYAAKYDVVATPGEEISFSIVER